MSHMRRVIQLIMVALLLSPSYLLAEDTEIFSDEIPPAEPNLLFLLDQSGSMNQPIGTAGETRLTSLQSAFNAVVSDPGVKKLKIGLMGFSNGVGKVPNPHGVSFPVSPIDDEALPIMQSNFVPETLNAPDNRGYFTLADDNLPDPVAGQAVRNYLPQILSGWTAYGATPIVDAYYEAALYFRGEAPFWGAASADQNHAAHPSTYSGSVIADVTTTPTGSTQICVEATCGINCTPTVFSSYCAAGEASCYLGTNCKAIPLTYSYGCSLATEAECLASDPQYSSCTASTSTNCSQTCDGGTHPESGACLGTETEVCTNTESITCTKIIEYTQCDRDGFQCDVVTETLVDNANATYTSPITDECQNNTIVVLSDGQPFVESDTETDNTRAQVKSMIGLTANCSDVPGQILPETVNNSLADGRCGTELASFLSTQDQSADVEGDNTIQTYTVGFGVGSNPEAEAYLRSLALSGGGEYFPASNTAALVTAFKSIISDLDASARSFAAPVYTVDPSSALSNSDDIYLPLFENSSQPGWAGNIKKFKLNSEGKIVDASDEEAIDENGALKPEAIDFWADTSVIVTKANPVTNGGAASRLGSITRRLLTDDGSALVSLSDANVSKGQLGDSSMADDYKNQLLNYIKGYQADGTTPRNAMGDILHSKPTVISYGSRQVLFFGTNEGYLHAIDAADFGALSSEGGSELFAYMPSPLLSNIDGLLKNTELTGPVKRIYGVDGAMSAWIIDGNKNGKVDASEGEKAYLFFGLRRGGSEYYALDITDPVNPSLAWKITNQGAFSQLGETGSKPTMAKLRYLKSGTLRFEHVLVFGGGYDNRLDDATLASSGTPPADIKGNGVYIVNARTGDLIWSYSGRDLKHSVPSNIQVLDIDRDGSIDRLYFGDTGGNIWRADLNIDDVDDDASKHDVTNDARVSKFASLGGSGVNARKFFYEPDVAIFKHQGKGTSVMSIGSGYRAHPLDASINDRFYVLHDENVFAIPTTPPTPLTEADLANSSALAGNSFLPTYKGWYKELTNGDGEKVLASPLIFQNKVVFTTFTNTSGAAPAGDGCAATSTKETRAYVLDLMAARATVDLDGSGSVDGSDQSTLISRGDILAAPQVVFNKPKDCTHKGCKQDADIRVGKKLIPLHKNSISDYLPKVFWINK